MTAYVCLNSGITRKKEWALSGTQRNDCAAFVGWGTIKHPNRQLAWHSVSTVCRNPTCHSDD